MSDALVYRADAALRRAHRVRWFQLVLGVAVLVGVVVLVGWSARHVVLTAAGRLLVADDPLEPVDLIVVSVSDLRAGALEAAHLYGRGMGAAVALPTVLMSPVDDEIRRLGVAYPSPTSLAAVILERAGVPRDAIVVMSEPVDATDPEVAALGAFVRERMPRSILFVTSRTHTARTRWLLRRQLPAEVRLAVHSPQADPFAVDSWWRDRDQTREVVMEYLRWFNSVVLRDPWSR